MDYRHMIGQNRRTVFYKDKLFLDELKTASAK